MGVAWTLEGLYRPAIFYADLEALATDYLEHLGGHQPRRDRKTRRLDFPTYRTAGTPDLIADALLEDLAHNREHFTKITSTLRPAFRGVIGEPLGRIFSPPPGARAAITWGDIARESLVVYIGLASMLFPDVANRVGRVILQDLVGFLGRRYAYDDPATFMPITMVIDEVARVAYPEFPTALAMSREAGGRFILAQQSLADMEGTLGNRTHARQIYENCNTRIWCRVSDETAEQASEGLPECTVQLPKRPSARHTYGDVGGLSGSADLTWESQRLPIVALDWFSALPRGHAYARMRGEVWKLRIPLLQEVPETELAALGLLDIRREVSQLAEAPIEGEVDETLALPMPPLQLPEHTLTFTEERKLLCE